MPIGVLSSYNCCKDTDIFLKSLSDERKNAGRIFKKMARHVFREAFRFFIFAPVQKQFGMKPGEFLEQG